MAKKTERYVDTSAFIAFLDRSGHHARSRRLFSEPPWLVTSTLVIAKGHGWFLRRYDQQRALQFLVFVDALTDLNIQPFDAAELAKASRILKKFADQRLTLADSHGLAIENERRIVNCWSTHRHLGLTGASLVT